MSADKLRAALAGRDAMLEEVADTLERFLVEEDTDQLRDLLEMVRMAEGPACRECGCTHHLPCEEGCWWVEEDLCSECYAESVDGPPVEGLVVIGPIEPAAITYEEAVRERDEVFRGK